MPNVNETWPKCQPHGLVKMTKFQANWPKIVDFSLIAYLKASAIFNYPVFTSSRVLTFQNYRKYIDGVLKN